MALLSADCHAHNACVVYYHRFIEFKCLCMAFLIIEALLLCVLAIVALVCILFVAVSLFIAHVHRKYGHLPGPPYYRCSYLVM